MVPPYTSLTAILLAVSLVPRKTGAFVALPSINQHSRFMTRSFSVRQDFYHEPHFEVASPVQVDTINKSMDKMLECAQQGECSVEELDRMIADLDKDEERQTLKEALVLQRELALVKHELDEQMTPHENESKKSPSFPQPNHAFQHYVDYKDIGIYESH